MSAYNGSPSIHSLPQLSGSPVLRGHGGWAANVDDGGRTSTMPSCRPALRPDFGQLQAQLQQRLSQQRIRSERSTADWRPVSDCGSVAVDTQGVDPAAAAPFSRYSAPPAAGMLIKSDKMTTSFVSSSAPHATPPLPSPSSAAAAAVKPGQSVSTCAAARPQAGVSARPGPSLAAISSTPTVSRSPPTPQHVRSAATAYSL